MTPHALYPLYVIVLNWNLPADTIQCVDSVLDDPPSRVKVIVVDNGSSDRSVEIIRERFGAAIDIIENEQNLGFAGGMNAGVRKALDEGAGSVLLLNNDTEVESTMIHQLALAAADSPQAGVVGPVIYYHAQPQRVWRFGDREYRWLPIPMQLSDKVLSVAGDTPFQLDYVTGGGMLVRRVVFETIGLFDSHYFMYFEDADFCRRAREAGFEIWCAPRAKMWHKVSLSAARQKPAMRYAQAWGRAHFYHTHPHGFSRKLTFAYLMALATKTTVQDALCRDGELVKPMWHGTLDGYLGRPSRHSDFFNA